jgi:hypothetical protein
MAKDHYGREMGEFDPTKDYTPAQLDAFADDLLREDSRSEVCRDCGERGEETGAMTPVEGVDEAGEAFTAMFPEFTCSNEHTWALGEGKMRGIDGDNPILFKVHIDSRKRREIYTASGTPDPEIVSGIYNRTHPQGRKVNSKEQRTKNGASFFR